MDKVFADFAFSSSIFHLQAEDKITKPSYKGSTFRGGFGHAFKKVVGAVRDKD